MSKNTRRDALSESAARLFTVDRMSYSKIAAQLGLTKKQAKAKVWAGLATTPQLVRKEVRDDVAE